MGCDSGRAGNHSVMGGAVARQPNEPRYAETMVVLVLVIVIVVVIVTPRWNCSYHIAAPACRGGVQREGQDAVVRSRTKASDEAG